MIEETLTALLKGVTPKVYPLVAPSGATAPFAVYNRASTTRLRDMAGAIGVAAPTFRVDLYAASFLTARQLADAARLLLDGYSDAEIMDVELVQDRDLSDLTTDPNLSRVQLEFRVPHREATRPQPEPEPEPEIAGLAADLSNPANSAVFALF